MIRIFGKELNTFFSSLTAYIAIGVFLVITGLFLWVFPDYSLLDYCYATLDQFFDIAPWIFTFLIPAITMRTLAEEKQTGTIEFLVTKPLTIRDIVLGKYLACLALVAFAILPTLLYFYSISDLGSPKGNVDTGAILASYFGLLLLGGAYASIGLFTSSLTKNQIVAFMSAAFLCFFLHWGFYYISALPVFFGNSDAFVQSLGIENHYYSISRGVIDTRDLVYFLSVIIFFLGLTIAVLSGKKARKSLLILLGVLVCINIISSRFRGDLDLTEDQRYSLSAPVEGMLGAIQTDVTVKVFMTADFLPADYKRFKKAIAEKLDDFQAESSRVSYLFEDPNKGDPALVRNRAVALQRVGIKPFRAGKDRQGKDVYVFPAAVVEGADTVVVNLMVNDVPGAAPETVVNNSISLLEYNLADAIRRASFQSEKVIAFTEGHGELPAANVADMDRTLRAAGYAVGRLPLDKVDIIDPRIDLLVVAKPRTAFPEKDKFLIDQYVMGGGKVIWLLDRLTGSLDSMLMRNAYTPYDYPLNLEDQLFKYGYRIEPNIVMDFECTPVKLVTGDLGGAAQTEVFDWHFHPAAAPFSDNPIVKNLDRVQFRFASTVDTIATKKTDLKKTVLLRTSNYTMTKYAPFLLSFDLVTEKPPKEAFKRQNLPLAVLSEGVFPSAYEFKATSEMKGLLQSKGQEFRTSSVPTKMLVVGDGDIIKNDYDAEKKEVRGLGFDRVAQYTFANKDFLMNAIEYMLDDGNLVSAKNREVKLKLLDCTRAEEEKNYWRFINIVLPLILLLLFGFAYFYVRRMRFGR